MFFVVMFYDYGDYQSFLQDIQETDWEPLKNQDIEIYAKNVTELILKFASKQNYSERINKNMLLIKWN